jgi:murein L,D-transpeptidase YafK
VEIVADRIAEMRVLAAAILLLTSWPVLIAQNKRVDVDRLIVYKHERKLVLLSGGKEVRSYKIALGAEPVGPKTRHGDHRTPEGSYILDSRNPNSHFYKAFHISYPNSNDLATAKTLGVNPGGDIMLHGLPKEYAWVGKAHVLHDWTDGCIAVTNEEMDDLWKLVRIGTPIEIKP